MDREQHERHAQIEIGLGVAAPQVTLERRVENPAGQQLVVGAQLLDAARRRPGLASRSRQRYSPTASSSPRRTRSASQGEKSVHGTQLDGAWVRERQGKSG